MALPSIKKREIKNKPIKKHWPQKRSTHTHIYNAHAKEKKRKDVITDNIFSKRV